MFLKRIAKTGIRIFRQKQDYWFGKKIIKDSPHASPDFMIIGSPKCGTTSLFQYLAQHPSIIPPKTKESYYFNGSNKRGLKQYLQNYPLKEKMEDKITFDATPGYIHSKRAPQYINHLFPNMKFIVIMRNPVKRAFSHWSFMHARSKESNLLRDDRTFEEAVNQELDKKHKDKADFHFLYKGMYAKHLKMWYQYYPFEDILLLDFGELKNNPKSLLNKICHFLSINPIYDRFKQTNKKTKWEGSMHKQNNNQFIHYNISPYKSTLNKEMEKRLISFFVPYNKELEQLTGRKFSWMG
jgi:hypothetical protein